MARVRRSKDCLITIELAYALRDVVPATDVPGNDQVFRCVGCRYPVRPVSLNSGELHFEHVIANPNCSLTFER